MDIIQFLNENQIKDLHGLYQNEWWTRGRTLEETRACVRGSQLCLGMVDKRGSLQGFTRILTDYIFKALIFDFIISNKYRNKGLGDRLMTSIKHHPELKSIKHFELYCLPEMFAFYEKFGFSTDTGNIRLMRLVNEY